MLELLADALGGQRKLGLQAEARVVHGKLKCLHSLWVLELLAGARIGSGSLGCERMIALVTVS